MFFVLSKILSFLLNPFFWILILLLWGILSANPLRKKKMLWSAVTLLLFFGNSIIVNEIKMAQEQKWKALQPATFLSDTAVLLGGFAFEVDQTTHFAESGDRMLQALKGFESGEINTLVVSGGSGSLSNPKLKEAWLVKNYMTQGGFRTEGLLFEAESRNTYENAQNTRELLGPQAHNIVLITSAFHMKRAMGVFKKAGFNPQPLPTHFMSSGKRQYSLEQWIIPQAKSFFYWELLIKERLGLTVYKLKGYME